MVNRIFSLLIFRGILLSLTLGYQILSLVFPFPSMPFTDMLWVVGFLMLLNLSYTWYLLSRTSGQLQASNFIFFQLTTDILAVSLLVMLTGGVHSNFKFAYLIFILLSALFLEKIAIYALTIISLALYFFSLRLSQFLLDDIYSLWYWSDVIEKATVAQFVLCFLTALLSGFMQTTYRNSRQVLAKKDLHIHKLREIRRKIVETLPSGLMICEDDGAVTFINQVGRRLLNIAQDRIVAINAWTILGIESRPETIQHKPTLRIERQLTISGTRKIIGISYTPMEQESGGQGYMLVFQDLTKFKMLEEHRSLNDRMTAIGQVAAGVAHEIRNPLAAISGSVQVLKELVPEGEAAQELAGIVDKETKRLDNIISQFLAYAKPGIPAAFNPVRLDHCILDFHRLSQNDVRLKTLILELELSEGEQSLILADEGKLNQVFWNLASNSYYASEQGGIVIIGSFIRAESVVFFIEDFGKGMSEKQVKNLFTPFQSYSKSGTGLGMSVVYDIIKMHHGEISVKSRLQEGTRVEIIFSKYKE